jgi:hypothetical protein
MERRVDVKGRGMERRVDVKGRGMEKGRGCIGKGDGRGKRMGTLLITRGCPHRMGMSLSCEGVLIAWGWTHRAGVFSSRRGDVAVMAPIRSLVAPS